MVIQRWQSLLLLFSTLLMSCFCFSPLGQIQGASQSLNIYSYALVLNPQGDWVLNTFYITVIAALTAILTLSGIFMYKNTRQQKRVCMLSLVLTIATMCSAYLVVEGCDIPGKQVSYYTMAFAPFVCMLTQIGAYRCISADERKLAAADRLR